MSTESLQVVYSHNLKENQSVPVEKLAELFPEPNYIEKLSYDIEKQVPANQVAELQKFLNKPELDKLKTSGFVVTDRVYKGGYEVLSFGEALYKIYSQDKNLFVSTDMILQAWHQSFDNVLIDLERYLLLNQLKEILTAMASVLPTYTKLNPSLDKSVFADLNLYLAVALHFLGETKTVSKLTFDAKLFKTLTEKITQANSTEPINLFGRQTTMDFSQFKPRGHYTRSALLSQYFQVISWLGKLELPVTPAPDFNITDQQALYGLQMSVSLYEILVQSNMYDMWSQYDNAIRMLIGVSDNMTFRDLKSFVTTKDLKQIQSEMLKTTVGIQAYGTNADMVLPGKNENELPRIFAFLGPRFAIDSWAMDKLIFKENSVKRRMTSSLDIAFTTLANNATVAEHTQRIKSPKGLRDGIEIQSRLISARNATDSLPATFWTSSIYNLWIHALRQLSVPTTGKNFPEAMRTKSWASKEVNTQLASWTTLRHDTIAYVKPARATFCGCDFPVGFVEPKIEFWNSMKEMCLAMAKFIENTTFLKMTVTKESQWSRDEKLDLKQFQVELISFYKRFVEILDVLTRLSEKEVNKVPFSSEENHWIRRAIEEKVGGSGFGSYTGWYYDMYYPNRYEALKADVLVADVFTNYPDMETGSPGSVLHEGVGEVDILVMVAENVGAQPGKKPERVVQGRMDRGKPPPAIPNPSSTLTGNEGAMDKTAVFYGPVYSYYEFETALNERLTDGEWGSLIDSPKIPERPSWTKEHLVHTFVQAKKTEKW